MKSSRFRGYQMMFMVAALPLPLLCAQDEAAPKPEGDAAAEPKSAYSVLDMAVREPLNMKAVIAMALQNNGDIKGSDLEAIIAQEKIKSAQQVFDLQLDASYVYQYIDSPQNAQDFVSTGGSAGNPFNPAPNAGNVSIFEQRNSIAELGITKRLHTGTILDIGTSVRVLDNTLNRRRPPGLFNPEWETFTGLTITQPLLRDGGKDANLAGVRSAMANAKVADLEWQLETSQVVAQVMKRYYDVVFTMDNISVQREAIGLAQKLWEDTKAKSEEGVAAPTEVRVAEAGMYKRMEDALAAEVQYIQRQNALQLLFKSPDDVIANSRVIVPVDKLDSAVPVTGRDHLVRTALKRRMELKQASHLIDAKSAEYDFADNQAKPRLDLVMSGGVSGLAGDGGQSYSESASGQGVEWSVGVQFSMPWDHDNLRAQRRIARNEVAIAEVRHSDVKTRIALEIDTVIMRIRADHHRLEATRKSREAAAESAEAGLKRFNEGVATSFEVLQLQEEFSKARSRELAALADLNKSIVDLELATGTLLEKQGVVPVSKVSTILRESIDSDSEEGEPDEEVSTGDSEGDE